MIIEEDDKSHYTITIAIDYDDRLNIEIKNVFHVRKHQLTLRASIYFRDSRESNKQLEK